MNENEIIKKEYRFCPECNKDHEVSLIKRKTECVIKDQTIEYNEIVYFCDKKNEIFETSTMINNNLLEARDKYREKNNLLTSNQIKNIRNKFQITQEELSLLLDLGAKTITRYETKLIQEKAYDTLIKLFDTDYNFALDCVRKHKEEFNLKRFEELFSLISGFIIMQGNSISEERALENEYIFYEKENDYNGNIKISINKVKSLIAFFVENTFNVCKVKLMKLLWYADAFSYISTGKSMTGLVYQHMPYGALPIGWYKIINLDSVDKEEFKYNENLCTEFKPKTYSTFEESFFNEKELEILNRLAIKFKKLGGKELSDLMHNENVYKDTVDKEYINFKNIKNLKVKI